METKTAEAHILIIGLNKYFKDDIDPKKKDD
jgi:hypothetical protein